MGFFNELFAPAWMSENEEKASKAVGTDIIDNGGIGLAFPVLPVRGGRSHAQQS